MGMNVAGFVINKNYTNHIDELQEKLGFQLEEVSDIDFETASENWKEENVFDLYFTEKGTLIFVEMDVDPLIIEKQMVLTFANSETSMAFRLDYYVGKNLQRSLMEVEGERVSNDGDEFMHEEDGQEVGEVVFNQMEEMLGESFWSIEPDAKAVRYKKVIEEVDRNYRRNLRREEQAQVAKDELKEFESDLEEMKKRQSSNQQKESEQSQSDWWKFWK